MLTSFNFRWRDWNISAARCGPDVDLYCVRANGDSAQFKRNPMEQSGPTLALDLLLSLDTDGDTPAFRDYAPLGELIRMLM